MMRRQTAENKVFGKGCFIFLFCSIKQQQQKEKREKPRPCCCHHHQPSRLDTERENSTTASSSIPPPRKTSTESTARRRPHPFRGRRERHTSCTGAFRSCRRPQSTPPSPQPKKNEGGNRSPSRRVFCRVPRSTHALRPPVLPSAPSTPHRRPPNIQSIIKKATKR